MTPNLTRGLHRALAIVGAIVATASSSPIAQGSQQAPPVFRGAVDLVTVDVTVVDRDGKPVKGLEAQDFVVTLDGRREPVRALDYLEFGSPPAPPSVGGGSSARAANPAPVAGVSRGGRVILLVIDDLSAKPTQMMGFLAAARRMLPTLDAGDLVGVATTSGLGPAVSPTRDRAAVAAALASKDVVGRNDDTTAPLYISIPEAIDITRNVAHSFAPDRGYGLEIQTTFARVVRRECFDLVADPKVAAPKEDRLCATKVIGSAAQLAKNLVNRAAAQLAAYTHLIDALGRAPAPRVIVALSAGVALGVDRGSFEELDPVSRAAARAGVQLYALADVPDAGDINDMGPDRAAARREEDAFLTGGVQTVATAAGGEAFKVVGQADRFFRRIASETSGMYQLGVQAPAVSSPLDFVNVKVSVNRSGLTVRTKAHALTTLSPAPADVPGIDAALQTRLAQGGAAFGVPVTAATTLRKDPASAQLQIGVNVQLPGTTSAPLIAMFAVIDDRGRVVQQGRKQVAPAGSTLDYQLAFPVAVDPGEYRLRVAVADADGNIGSVEQSVSAALEHLGNCHVSDLFTTWVGADAIPRSLALEPLPDSASSLRVSLELYPDSPAAAAALTVRLAILAEGQTNPLLEDDLTPIAAGPFRTIVASIPAGAIKPGIYTVRATILEAGAVTGTVSAPITRK